MTATKRITMLALVAAAALLGARGCGGVQASRAGARDSATKAACDRYAGCNLIGSGLTYETRESCEIVWQSNWESAWPAANCEGQIDNDALKVCLNAIAATDCTGFDFLSTLGKCGKQNVCGTGADGGG